MLAQNYGIQQIYVMVTSPQGFKANQKCYKSVTKNEE